jgi:hypothetical protein
MVEASEKAPRLTQFDVGTLLSLASHRGKPSSDGNSVCG